MNPLSPAWQDFLSKRKPDAPLAAARLQQLPALARLCGFSNQQLEAISGYAAHIGNMPMLFANWAAALAAFAENDWENLLAEPFPEKLHDGLTMEAFLLTLAIAEIPTAEDNYSKRGIPVEKLYEAMDSLVAWTANCERNFGITGLRFDHGFPWIALRILPGTVLRFGRLEFNQSRAFFDVLAFRHRKTGKRRIILTGTQPFNDKGEVALPSENQAFTTHIPSGCFSTFWGFEATGNGTVTQEPVSISDAEWECVLRPWDPVLYMHIPESGPLSPDAAQTSFHDVADFFDSPESSFHPKAIISASWLFDPVLQTLLPADANLCKFQKTGHILPPSHIEGDAIYRVFGPKAEAEGIHAVTWKTTLQKKLGDFLDSGGVIRGARFLKLLP